jgi:hypothetical protein
VRYLRSARVIVSDGADYRDHDAITATIVEYVPVQFWCGVFV